jgi:aminopeptidase YwaD
MTPKAYLLICCLFLNSVIAFTKTDKKRVEQLRADITFLASDSLEGRRTGSVGEIIAANYIAQRFTNLQIAPLWANSYLQNYQVVDGKKIGDNHILKIFNDTISTTQFAAMPYSANGEISELVMPKLNEQGSYALVPISTVTKKLVSSPHDTAMVLFEKHSTKLIDKGAKGIIYYNDIDADHDILFEPKQKSVLQLPQIILFINYDAAKKHITPKLKADWIDIYAVIDLQDNIREGRNVGAFINNNAANTVVIGAHFDHLGYGEDHNSLFTGKDKQIHNGADDNASGVAAMLALAQMVKGKKYNNCNYILLSFSGEELGLYGSKKFTEMNTDLLKNVNYMVNIDMLGRYDDTKKSITIGGVGTSPVFIPAIEKSKKFFTPKYDSAGIGPSDHTSFYTKDIPVLFFFTGLHTDYHKPTDDADKINFVGEENLVQYIASLMQTINKAGKLQFTKTREPKMEGTRFKVTLGIMPDYTYSGIGVRADGITEGRVGSKAGMKTGDIITQLGTTKIADMQVYMKALAGFKKGDVTTVKVLRGKEEVELKVVFE